jgi:hypothetical protein
LTTIAPGRARQARLPSASKLAAYAIGFAPTAAMFAAAGRAPVRLAWAPWALTAGVLYLPARALVPPPPPPLPGPYPPARPTSAVPLAALGATLLLDGIVVAALGRRPGGRS